jgi:hypothetical protein
MPFHPRSTMLRGKLCPSAVDNVRDLISLLRISNTRLCALLMWLNLMMLQVCANCKLRRERKQVSKNKKNKKKKRERKRDSLWASSVSLPPLYSFPTGGRGNYMKLTNKLVHWIGLWIIAHVYVANRHPRTIERPRECLQAPVLPNSLFSHKA